VVGEPDTGKLYVRFDEGVQETCSCNAPALYSTAPPAARRADRCAIWQYLVGGEKPL